MTSAQTGPTALQDLKVKQQKIWSSGDYGRIAWITVPLGRELAEAVEVRPGSQVLDVACGTGHVALEAARRFCEVTGLDYVPALVDIARRRAAAEGLEVDFQVGDAEALPFADDSFDFVLSAIGVMFTADHDRAGAELVRSCRPGRQDRIGKLDSGRLRRPAAQDGRQACRTAARCPAAHPMGDRSSRCRSAG